MSKPLLALTFAQVKALSPAVCKTAPLGETRGRLAQAARSVLWTVAGQLAEECRASPGGGQNSSPRACYEFLYGFKGAPAARQRGPGPRKGIGSWRREVPERNA